MIDSFRRPARVVPSTLAAVVLALICIGCSSSSEPSTSTVDVIPVTGVIDPPTSDYLSGRIARAQADGVYAAVIQLDTPGGLDISMREIVRDMQASTVPIIVWVAPRGSRAGSAGTFITYAADLAYMAEATNIGAATPVDLGAGGGNLSRKIINDAAAFIEELAVSNGRDREFARDAVIEGASIGATEAAQRGVIDDVTSSLGGLLQEMDGENVDRPNGGELVLETWDEDASAPSVRFRFQQMNFAQRVLHAVTSPEIAFLLLLFGFFGIVFELYNPGIGLAGILGAIALLLAFYALSVLPTNWVGVLFVVLAIVLFVVDVQTAGLGLFTVGGVTSLVVGGLLLFAGADPRLSLSPWAVVVAVFLTLVFFISVMTAALRVRLRRPIAGQEAIIGTVAVAKTDIAPEGTVVTKGSLWQARTMETGIAAGEQVKVMATEGLVLLVEPLSEAPTTEASQGSHST